jgi:hypothetical protein
MGRPGIALPSGCTLINRHGLGIQEVGAAFATVGIAHDALLSLDSWVSWDSW